MNRHAQPLWSWALAAALAALILTGLTLDPAGQVSAATDLNLARLDPPTAAPLIVLIGSSKLQCAVGFDDELGRRLKAQGVDAKVVRITRQGAVYGDLAVAFDRLRSRRPTLVAIEEDLLLVSHRAIATPEAVSWRARAKRAIRVRLGLRRIAFNEQATGGQPCGPGPPPPLSAAAIAAYRQSLDEFWPSAESDRRPYLAQIAALRARGVRVVLLEAPRPPIAWTVLPRRLGEALPPTRALLARQGLARVGPASPFLQSAFTDDGHLNATGRALYMDWLTPRLAGLVQGGQQGGHD